jgi:hypothetical protein
VEWRIRGGCRKLMVCWGRGDCDVTGQGVIMESDLLPGAED